MVTMLEAYLFEILNIDNEITAVFFSFDEYLYLITNFKKASLGADPGTLPPGMAFGSIFPKRKKGLHKWMENIFFFWSKARLTKIIRKTHDAFVYYHTMRYFTLAV